MLGVWDRRAFEALRGGHDEFYPNVPLALLDIPAARHAPAAGKGHVAATLDAPATTFEADPAVPAAERHAGRVRRRSTTSRRDAPEAVVPLCPSLRDTESEAGARCAGTARCRAAR